MHGMNVRVQIQSGKIEDAARLLREEIMPTAASYRGFIQNFLLVDAPNSRLATLSALLQVPQNAPSSGISSFF